MAIGVSKFTPTTSSNLSNFDQCRFENLGRGLAAVKSALYVALCLILLPSTPSPPLSRASTQKALRPTEWYIYKASARWSL
jgi:hypothetical protein